MIQGWYCKEKLDASHPVLRSQLSKSQICFPLVTVLYTSIKVVQKATLAFLGWFIFSDIMVFAVHAVFPLDDIFDTSISLVTIQ